MAAKGVTVQQGSDQGVIQQAAKHKQRYSRLRVADIGGAIAVPIGQVVFLAAAELLQKSP